MEGLEIKTVMGMTHARLEIGSFKQLEYITFMLSTVKTAPKSIRQRFKELFGGFISFL